ncbi:MAG: ribonuclease HII [Bacteroidetes bacterium GWF2_43_63]|nr:MAG: ribonuclease HII [Bacteroidetes bacterium GWE2_42_42]OFY52977.1 MAG: ribonuclease HII [Bacteroidetes bacterium GWF2_43_63]HBG70188.1 ribonuclease HII [Bacteroidales bacterium]HCB62204.1 ribonuclease HII [Bacteroidales bacterium]
MAALLHHYSELVPEAGCDEAGRGCLAGPVTAAVVILPANFFHPLLDDSKKLNEKERALLREIIEEQALDWAVAFVDHKEIDKINILNASIRAMHLALGKLKTKPAHIIVDGNRFKPFRKIPHTTIIKGDGKYMSIAAASILAKTHRDEFMIDLHENFPQYGWNENKGYPSPGHKKAIAENGITSYHRRSFRLNEQLKIQF